GSGGVLRARGKCVPWLGAQQTGQGAGPGTGTGFDQRRMYGIVAAISDTNDLPDVEGVSHGSIAISAGRAISPAARFPRQRGRSGGGAATDRAGQPAAAPGLP